MQDMWRTVEQRGVFSMAFSSVTPTSSGFQAAFLRNPSCKHWRIKKDRKKKKGKSRKGEALETAAALMRTDSRARSTALLLNSHLVSTSGLLLLMDSTTYSVGRCLLCRRAPLSAV